MIVVHATSLDVDYSENDDCSSLQLPGKYQLLCFVEIYCVITTALWSRGGSAVARNAVLVAVVWMILLMSQIHLAPQSWPLK